MAQTFTERDQLPENDFLNNTMKIPKPQFIKSILLKIKSFLLGVGLFLFAALATFSVMLSTDEDKIKGMLIAEMNRRMNAEISAGDLHFSVIRTFPMATFRFEDVLVMEPSYWAKPDTLTYASSIALSFNMLDFFKGEYKIRRLTVADGMAFPKTDEDGVANYHLWQNGADDYHADIHFDIQRIDLENIRATYQHKSTHQLLDITVQDMRFFTNPAYHHLQFTADGSFTVHRIRTNDHWLPENIAIETKLEASIGAKSDLSIAESQIVILGHHLQMNGNMQIDRGEVMADLQVSASDLQIESLLADLPVSWKAQLKTYEPAGRLHAELHIKGLLSDLSGPELSASYRISQGSISLPAKHVTADISELEGSFIKDAHRPFSKAKIDVRQFKATSADADLEGSLSLSKLKSPEISFELLAQVSPKKLVSLFPRESLSQSSGQVMMDIAFTGAMSHGDQFTREDLLASQLSGEITLEDVSFIVNDNQLLPYHQIHASLVFKDNNLHMNNLSGKAGSSDFAVSGVMHNVLPFLFLDDEEAMIQAQLHSNHINMDEILQLQTHESDTTYRLRVPSRIRLGMQAAVGDFTFREFRAGNLQGQARISDGQFFADHLELEAMGGKVLLEGLIDARPDDRIHISCQADLVDVDIHQLFFQTGNFGQQGIRHDHIYGRMTAGLHFSSTWSPELDIDWKSMQTNAKLTIEDGRLIDYKPLIALGRYIRTSDLSNVSFSTLENEIHIQNRVITIPSMEISSSALDLQLSGKHTFDNEIDYRLQVLLSDILAREHRERRNPQEQYGDIIDDGLHTTLFLQLSGDFDNPRFRYDHRGAREQLKDNLRAERENLRQILREEFRFLSRDAQEDTDEQKKTNDRLQKREAGGFIIEWEELE